MKAVVSFNILFFFSFWLTALMVFLSLEYYQKVVQIFPQACLFKTFFEAYALSPIGITFCKNWEAFLSSWAPVAGFYMPWFSVLNRFPCCDM